MKKQLAIIAIITTVIWYFTGCAAVEINTPYGSASFDGKKTVKLSYTGK